MNRKIGLADFCKTGIACAIAYSIPLLFFFKQEQSTDSWILYLGNFAFTFVLLIATFIINKKLHDETSVMKMLATGASLSVAGILFTIPFMGVLLLLFGQHIVLHNPVSDSPSGLFFMLLMNVVIVDIFMGCFAVLLAALVTMQYPKNKKGEEVT